MRIEGHAAIVTGGGSGLGAATARYLADRGARVAVLDRDADRAEETARVCGGIAVAADLVDPQAVAAGFAMVAGRLGAARILVNCAGVGPSDRILARDLTPMPLERFARTVAVNLTGTFDVMRHAAAAMAALEPLVDGERGVIVNTASITAFEGQVGQAHYAASKGGVAALTLPAARELADHGIRVLAVAPGLFETAMLAGIRTDIRDRMIESARFPRRAGRAAEFAALVGALIENPMMNGAVVRIDAAARLP